MVGPRPLDDRFFAVKEQQLDGPGVFPPFQHTGDFNKKRAARPAVVRAHESELPVQLRVVVAGNDHPLRPRAGYSRPQVDHVNLANRRVGVKGLVLNRDAERGHLSPDVLPRLLERGRSGRPRPVSDHGAQMVERPATVKCRRLGRCHGHGAHGDDQPAQGRRRMSDEGYDAAIGCIH